MMEGESPPEFVPRSRVKEVLKYEDLIPSVEQALVSFSDKENGGVIQPTRSQLLLDKDTMFLTMPAYSKGAGVFATKIISVFGRNGSLGLPSHMVYIILCDGSTGKMEALIDGEDITAMRTAAASAVAAKYMSPPESSVLCVIGTGTQALSHINAMKHIRSFKEIRVCSRNKEKVEQFAKDHGVIPFTSVQEAVKDADVIVTVTMSSEPVLFGDWVKKGAFIAAVGACRPDWRELDDKIIHDSDVIVDSIDGAMAESGDIILSKATVLGEIGNLITGKLKLTPGKTCIFKSLGMAVEDVAAAKLVYDKCVKK